MTKHNGVDKITEIIVAFDEKVRTYGYGLVEDDCEKLAHAIWERLEVCPECEGWKINLIDGETPCVNCSGKGCVVRGVGE